MPRHSTRATHPSGNDVEVDDQLNVLSQHDSVQGPDQLMDCDDEELSDQRPTRRSKKSNVTNSSAKVAMVKAKKSRKSRTRRGASDDEGGSEDDEPKPPFDRDEFLATARPIPLAAAKIIDGVVSDLQTVLHQLEHTGFSLVLDTAVAIEEASGNTEDGQEVCPRVAVKILQEHGLCPCY